MRQTIASDHWDNGCFAGVNICDKKILKTRIKTKAGELPDRSKLVIVRSWSAPPPPPPSSCESCEQTELCWMSSVVTACQDW